MSLERESLSELENQRDILQSKTGRAQDVFEHIATPGFSQKGLLRLDTADTDFDRYIDNLDRVTAVQERLRDRAIPGFQSQLATVNEQIESQTVARFERLNALRITYQRIEERRLAGLPVTAAVLTPIKAEIQRLEEFTQGVAPTVPVEPVQPATPVEVVPTEEIVKPIILVDRAKQELEINGKRVKFKNIQWNVLSVIYQKGWLVGATAQEVAQVAAEAGSTAGNAAAYIVHEIRRKIEVDPKNPQIITADKKARNSRYFWHAEKVDLQFIPSELVILEGTNQVEVDGRKVELKRLELVLLNALVSKMGLVFLPSELSSDAFGNPNTTETGLRNIFARLAKKINYAWGDQSLVSSGKRGLGAWYQAQNLVVSIKQAEREPEQVEKPAEPVIDIETSIAEIQRLVNDGVLVSPGQIARAQEAVKQLGGIIELQPSRVRKLTKEELVAPEIAVFAPKEAKGGMQISEESLIALDAILDSNISPVTNDEVLNLMGTMKNGRKFSWPTAKNSMVRVVGVLNASRDQIEANQAFLAKVKTYVGKPDEQDIKVVMSALNVKLTEWFRERLSTEPQETIENQQDEVTGPVVELEVQPLGVTVEQPPAPKLTERQAKRQEMITERVRGILAEISQIENVPDKMGSSRLTWLAKHHLGVTITDTDIQKFIDRGYIGQFPGNDHHPSYNQQNLLTATYLRRFGNNMSKAQRRELLKIISREFNAWQAQRSNQ